MEQAWQFFRRVEIFMGNFEIGTGPRYFLSPQQCCVQPLSPLTIFTYQYRYTVRGIDKQKHRGMSTSIQRWHISPALGLETSCGQVKNNIDAQPTFFLFFFLLFHSLQAGTLYTILSFYLHFDLRITLISLLLTDTPCDFKWECHLLLISQRKLKLAKGKEWEIFWGNRFKSLSIETD